jgi:hypothetical protein
VEKVLSSLYARQSKTRPCFTFLPSANEESGIMELSLRMRSGEDGEGGGSVPRYICTRRLFPNHCTIQTWLNIKNNVRISKCLGIDLIVKTMPWLCCLCFKIQSGAWNANGSSGISQKLVRRTPICENKPDTDPALLKHHHPNLQNRFKIFKLQIC